MYKDPIEKFNIWYKEAENNPTIIDASAAALATSTINGMPSVRMVLIKYFDKNGFVFCTNLGSKKSKDLKENNKAAILFHWPNRQVRIEGKAYQIGDQEADTYFDSRPLQSKIISILSKQSQILENEEDFTTKINEYNEKDIKRPIYWSGFRVIPSSIEFWTQGKHRNHKRIIYVMDENGSYKISQLYP
jgi:pyridoxamine 5'-phosphate oxidase